jgi:hypothetical protein
MRTSINSFYYYNRETIKQSKSSCHSERGEKMQPPSILSQGKKKAKKGWRASIDTKGQGDLWCESWEALYNSWREEISIYKDVLPSKISQQWIPSLGVLLSVFKLQTIDKSNIPYYNLVHLWPVTESHWPNSFKNIFIIIYIFLKNKNI